MMRTGSSLCRDRASASARKKFCSAAGFSMPLRGGSSATVTRLEMRLSVRRASRKIVDSFPMTAAIITRSRTWVNVVTHTFPRRRDARLRAAAAGSRRKCAVKLDAGEFHARGAAINHRAEADALWRPFFRAGAEHSIAERGERRALRGQLSLAHEDPRAAEPRAVVAVMSGVRVPFFRILKRLLARVAIVCKPPCAMKSLHDLVVIASEFQKEQFEVRMLDEEAIGPGALQGDALIANRQPQLSFIGRQHNFRSVRGSKRSTKVRRVRNLIWCCGRAGCRGKSLSIDRRAQKIERILHDHVRSITSEVSVY